MATSQSFCSVGGGGGLYAAFSVGGEVSMGRSVGGGFYGAFSGGDSMGCSVGWGGGVG